ncbi:MAG: cytochrome b/b6 domain-containing protein [Syntrophaceae bacterium]|nr:cytochrome b/b6 domain-containing protein [Syntrophaceae bacterium]
MERILQEEGAVLRHSLVERLEHWVLAISGLVLVFSGFGELPMYKRYMVTEIPGLSWAGDFYVNLKIHYLAAIVFVSVMVFHAVYHGWLGHRGLLPRKGDIRDSARTILSMFGFGEEPKADKYLPEQRLAYVYLAVVGLILVITGIFKVLKNLPPVYFPPWFITLITLVHTFATLFFLLGIIAHVAALIFKVNRPMVKPIFTGKMDLEYARKRHPIWYERLVGKAPAAEEVIAAPDVEGKEERKMEPLQAESAPAPVKESDESAATEKKTEQV